MDTLVFTLLIFVLFLIKTGLKILNDYDKNIIVILKRCYNKRVVQR